eukprot:GFKZ01001893.1.p2 GENE.GFKZ01001893.1~~GFKZ01001893.1.p2  ORF type:complete len:318 (-),score=27.98 GFKZ01001893.1:1392-2345(-)
MIPLSTCETKHFYGHHHSVSAITWNYDGTRLAAAGDKAHIFIWDTETFPSGKRQHERRWTHELRGHSGEVDVIIGSPTQRDIFASAGIDRIVNVYDLRTGVEPVFKVTAESKCLFGEWAPNGTSFAVGSSSNKLHIVDILSLKISKTFPFDREVNQFTWNPDGTRLHLACGDGSVQVYEWPSMRLIMPMEGHADACIGVACDPKGNYIAVSSLDTCVSMWDATSLSNIYTIDRWDVPAKQAEFSSDGQLLAIIGHINQIDIVDPKKGTLYHSLPMAEKPNQIAWHPRANLLAYAPSPPRYPTADFQPPVSVWGPMSK